MKEADYRLIEQYHREKGWPIKAMCQILEISRTAYYKWLSRKPSDRDLENEELISKIKEVARENNRLFGYRKMTMIINRDSETKYNHKRIYRLMCENDLDSCYRRKKPHWKKSDAQMTAENRMERDFSANRPNQKWGTDITEIKVPGVRDKAYISTILDHYDRFPVAVVVSRRNDTALVNRTLELAVRSAPEGAELFHSDRGFQYTRSAFQNRLRELGMQPSMSRAGRCIDNRMVESFQGQIKDMMRILYPDISSWEELEEAIYNTYDYYINKCLQARYNGKTSGEVRSIAMTASVPEIYPIRENLQIKRFWKMVNEKKTIR